LRHLKDTKSLCPECLRVVEAEVYEDGGVVYISKRCPRHGSFDDVYWSSYEQYERALKFEHVGDGLANPRTRREKGCPYDCGICNEHKSFTVLAIIDVTNRCNLRCPVCFANAGAAGYVYEPSNEEVKAMIDNFRSNEPAKPPGLQFSGGEPTLREDLPELIEYAAKAGFHHIEVNTNGVRLTDVDYCRELMEAGAKAIYLQFDGLTSDVYLKTRGVDLLEVKRKVIENCRKIGFDAVVLVPTLIKGVNDHQVGDIIKFAAKNADVIRCVNFQPVSICGRIDRQRLKEMRITIPDLMRLAEEQTGGQVKQSDWYPVPFVVPIPRAIGALKHHRYGAEFTAHPHCGMATYLFVEGDEIIPITRRADVEGFMRMMEEAWRLAEGGHGWRAKLKMLLALRYVKGRLLRKLIRPILKTGTYGALRDFHFKSILLASMHFMDPYNFDLERVQRCVIHYGVPDGRIVPFCTMNTIHRPLIERQFAMSWEEFNRRMEEARRRGAKHF
jgi:uncharacterized radical SAM superfamily Fe-S cluster-containing enzyme